MHRFICILAIAAFFSGCGAKGKIEDLIDSQNVPRKTIDVSQLGINAFGNQAFAGPLCSQYKEIKNVLRLKFVRVLFNWDDNVQPSPQSNPNFSFYDDILDCLPAGVDALVVLAHLPSWMKKSSNWINGNPRETFARKWVRKVAKRYAGDSRIVAFQIWNEPNNVDFSENETIGVLNSPINYVELLALSVNMVEDVDPARRVTNGATTSIAQNFPDSLNYNKAIRDAGGVDLVDFYSIHYYGEAFERFNLEVKDFLNGLGKPIWVTESGERGVNNQLAYAEKTWPFLRERLPGLRRIYVYRFAENSPSDITFGLKNPDPAFPVSDLYVYLRDRQ
ncbi:MAG: hypothetical protein D6719_12680 [Candidatus Dadabacteria bacterium]|nr:MAG: hypothetical protein D6719_12680 [Candidatus Dadabacteria bacterium]